MNPIESIRKDFPVFSQQPNLIYFDSAASALKVRPVIEQVDLYYNTLGVNVHRGAYALAYESTKMFEEARTTVAKWIHADDEEIVFTRGATSALNMVAHAYLDILQPGDEIITSELEHHSSLLPWQQVAKKTGAKLVYITLTEEGRITVEAFKKALSDQTKMVALTHVSNVMGYLTPIEDIIRLAHEKGAHVVLDAAQSAPHMALHVKQLDVDYLAFSGHKMFGPSGVGVLYGKKKLLDRLEPFEYGGEMVDQVTKESATWKEAPMRLEAGTPVISGAIGLAKAIQYIESIGFDVIHQHTHEIHQYALSLLQSIEGLTIYNPTADNPVIAFNLEGIHPHDVATFLDQYHISVRAGHHCAQLVSQFLGVVSTLRASIHIYNTKEDAKHLAEALRAAQAFFQSF